ncbi:MAG TPA: hypothetical protein VIK33_06470 [Anaerolineae bacterium]
MVQTDQPQAQSRRPIVLGVLNLVAAAIYLLLALNAANGLEDTVRQVPSAYRGSMRTLGSMDVVADGIACLGMLLGGLFLLQRRAAGRTVTQLVARLLVVSIVIILLYTIIAIGSAAGSILFTLALGLFLRFAYPIIAARLLNAPPTDLGLT